MRALHVEAGVVEAREPRLCDCLDPADYWRMWQAAAAAIADAADAELLADDGEPPPF